MNYFTNQEPLTKAALTFPIPHIQQLHTNSIKRTNWTI